MAKIAVDVVLIPPDEVMALAVNINRTFPSAAVENYVLDPTTCIPHITLLMGIIDEEQAPDVERRLRAVGEQFSALKLMVTGTKTSRRPNGKAISVLEIEKTPELLHLHEIVIDAVKDLFEYDGVSKKMFYAPPPVNEITLFWVSGFAKTSIRENYKPHITLGIGEPNTAVQPVHFEASTLALCHLGNYCTCRRVLFSSNLQK